MMFDKAYQSGAHYLVSDDVAHMPEYFKNMDLRLKINV